MNGFDIKIDNLPLLNQTHRRKPVTIYNARNGFRVIVNLDNFNLAEHATANSQQLPTAFRRLSYCTRRQIHEAATCDGAKQTHAERHNYFAKFL